MFSSRQLDLNYVKKLITTIKLFVVIHIYYPGTQEAEVGGGHSGPSLGSVGELSQKAKKYICGGRRQCLWRHVSAAKCPWGSCRRLEGSKHQPETGHNYLQAALGELMPSSGLGWFLPCAIYRQRHVDTLISKRQ